MTVRITRKTLAVVGVLAAVFAGTAAYAAIPDGGGVIHGCYTKDNGVLRVTDTATNVPKACTSKEVALNWNQQGPKGDPGPQGPKGDTGPKGDPGASDGYILRKDSVNLPPGAQTQVASIWLPTGSYMLQAKLQAIGIVGGESLTCQLAAGGDSDTGYGEPAIVFNGTPTYVGMMTAHEFAGAPGWATVTCSASDFAIAQKVVLTAIQVGKLNVW